MPSTTAAGTAIAISSTTPTTQDSAGYGALTYVEIGQVEKLGTIGATFAKVEFQPLKGPKQKHKGSADFGSLQPSMALDEADAGQALLRAAAADETSKLYSFRITYPTGAIRYFLGRVFGAPENVDGADSIVMSMPTVEINSKVVQVAASVGPAPTLTMTQLASPNRIYQRQTTTGGGQSKGQGSIDVQVSSSGAGTLYARTRAVSGGAVLQPAFTAGSLASGAQTVTVPGIDARLGWFYLDLSADGTTWQQGTVPVGMGRLAAVSGQSQAVRLFAKMPAYTGTNASLGVTIDPNTAVFARYTDTSRSLTTPAWAVPADASNYDSTFAAEFLRRQVASFGVNCGLIGHAVGSTAIAAWQPGTQNNVDFRAVVDAAGGFEAFYHDQGGDDAGAGTSYAAFQSGLSGVYGDLASHNAARGSNFERYLTTMATRTSAGAGTAASVQNIRKAGVDWAAANSTTYLEPHDVNLEDAVHQGQPGNIVRARHLQRATAGTFTAAPTIVSGSRSGVTVTLVSSSALTLLGDVSARFSVFAAGSTATPLTVSAATVSGTTITLTLSADPGNAQALDVYWLRHPDPSGTTAAANMLYDTFNDGMPIGRPLQPTVAAAVAVAAPGAALAPFRDSFTDTSGKALASHTPDTGQAWTQTLGSHFISSAGTLYGNTGTTARNAFDPGAADSFIAAKMVVNQLTSTQQALWLLGRSTAANTYYQFGYQQSGASGAGWYIGKTVGGTFTVLSGAFAAQAVAQGESYTVRGEMQGSTIRLLVNGVKVIEVMDTSITTTGAIGTRTNGVTVTDTTGLHLDDMSAGPL